MWLLYCSRGAIWCTELLYGSIHLPYGSIRLPYGTCGSYTVHTTPIWPTLSSHAAPILPPDSEWYHLAPTWLPYGTHGSSMVHMAPTWSPHSAYGSHKAPSASNMVHTAPIQCTQLSYDPRMSHVALTWCPLTPILHLQLQFCACGFHNGTRDSRMVPSSFQMVESGSHMAPTQCTWLQYGTHTSQMAPSASHMAPIQARSSHTSRHLSLL
jgi:hypothetical protein